MSTKYESQGASSYDYHAHVHAHGGKTTCNLEHAHLHPGVTGTPLPADAAAIYMTNVGLPPLTAAIPMPIFQ
ncbi:MAG: hypothetical protein PHX16_07275 [Syntrophaceticus sp.]|jgi:hypothetical protein|nr:hypothetical protein [Syntrophaceticus sp.]MDD3314927.1 hypothetical protein [Syntrophaceticus sp.]MDD4360394.1 hypothetical protein [Syntrophaceticus sp.]MDD4783417.1 hypothetical protein [Syntrophaceticus sp.]